jgi:hypothetical protein
MATDDKPTKAESELLPLAFQNITVKPLLPESVSETMRTQNRYFGSLAPSHPSVKPISKMLEPSGGTASER